MRHTIHDRDWFHAVLVVAALSIPGCSIEHEVDVKPTQHTVTVEPIFMTIDINLRVQRELDEFYSDVVGGEPPEKGGEL
jgi:hypothetical protein